MYRRNNTYKLAEYQNVYSTLTGNSPVSSLGYFFIFILMDCNEFIYSIFKTVKSYLKLYYYTIILLYYSALISEKIYYNKSTAHQISIYFLEIKQHFTCIFRLFFRQNNSCIARKRTLIIYLQKLRNMKANLKQSCCMRMCRSAA
jgi:hypothetical protein